MEGLASRLYVPAPHQSVLTKQRRRSEGHGGGPDANVLALPHHARFISRGHVRSPGQCVTRGSQRGSAARHLPSLPATRQLSKVGPDKRLRLGRYLGQSPRNRRHCRDSRRVSGSELPSVARTGASCACFVLIPRLMT